MTFYPKGSSNTDVADGAIRWTGAAFEQRIGGAWTAFGGGATSINGLTDGYTDAADNVLMGDAAQGGAISGGIRNTVLGRTSGTALTSGDENAFLGMSAGTSATIGSGNTYFGTFAGYTGTDAECCVAIGAMALYSSVSGYGNVCIGYATGLVTTGSYNMFLGHNAGHGNTTGIGNVAIGAGALYNANGNARIAIGQNAMAFGGGAAGSSAIGVEALYASTGINNTAIGSYSGLAATTATGCIYIGYEAGYSNTASNRLFIGNSRTSYLITGDLASGYVGINTNDLDGTPTVGSLTVKGASSNGSTKVLVLRDSTEANVFDVDTDGSAQNLKFKITAEGGYAVRLANGTGSNSVKGMLVKASTTADDAFVSTNADEAMPIGAVYEAGIANGQPCWVVMGGIAEVLLEDGVAGVHGYWCRTSITDAGYMTIAAAPPGGGIPELDRHEREIGHCLQSVGSGTDVLCRIIMHFN
jgi:hypothetical protein